MLLQLDVSPGEFWLDMKTFADGLIELRDMYNFDGILISLHGHDPDWRSQVVKVEKTGEGEIFTWKNGDKTIFLKDELPRHEFSNQIERPSIDDVDIDSIPDMIDYIPVSQGLYFKIHPEHKFDVIDYIVSRVGDKFSIHGEITSPFDYFLDYFGHQDALMFLIDDPNKCKLVLQRFTDGVKRLAVEMCGHGIDAIKISSPYAGAGFISPKFYREFVAPFESQIARAVREMNVHIYTHTCGAIGDRLEIMAETGISGIECLDPPPLGNVELEDAKRRIGDKIFIKGNIDSVNLLLYGNMSEIIDDVKGRISVGKRGGGYILSTACSIAPYVKREHVKILYELAEEYGKY
jgi:hypothetical protein